jgi:hypothetical protein
MTQFNRLCRSFEKMDPADYVSILAEKAVTVIPARSEIEFNGIPGTMLLTEFILGAIVADGRLSEDEYNFTYRLFSALLGESIDAVTYNKLLATAFDNKDDYKNFVDQVVDALGTLSDSLKDDIITICLVICAVDGKVSFGEKNWIKKLIR